MSHDHVGTPAASQIIWLTGEVERLSDMLEAKAQEVLALRNEVASLKTTVAELKRRLEQRQYQD